MKFVLLTVLALAIGACGPAPHSSPAPSSSLQER